MEILQQLKIITVSVIILILSVTDASSQNFSWAKGIGSTSNDYGHAVATDNYSNVYVTGYFTGTVDFDPGTATHNLTSAGSSDIFIAKYSQKGDYIWAVSVGGSSTDAGNDIAVDKQGNVYVTGYFSGSVDFHPGTATNIFTSYGTQDLFITKYSNSGTYQWAYGTGSVNWDWGQSVTVDTSGNVFFTGIFCGNVDFDPGSGTRYLNSNGYSDIFVVKYSGSGNLIFANSFGGSSADYGAEVRTDHSGNIFLTGSFGATVDFDPGSSTKSLTASGYFDVLIAKYSNSGNYEWAINLGNWNNTTGSSLDTDDSGNVYVAGCFLDTVDFDFGSKSYNLISSGGDDIFLTKYSSSGGFVWAKKIGGSSFDKPNSIAVDFRGNIYLTGEFEGTSDFNPGTGTANVTSAGINDAFIARYDCNGNYKWAYNVGGTSEEIGYGIAVHDSGNVFATGYIRSTTDFNPGTATYNLNTNGIQDIYITKLVNPDCTYFKAISTADDTTTFCQGGSVNLNANKGADYTYQWYRSGTPINGAKNESYKVTAYGAYTVVVTNAGSCIDTSDAIIIKVNSLPAAILTPATTQIICAGDSVLMQANLGPGYSWHWKKDGYLISGATDSVLHVTEPGGYNVIVTNNNGCSRTSLITKVIVNPLPDTSVVIYGNNPICDKDTVILKAKTDTGLLYQWRRNGMDIPGATQLVYPATLQGTYKLKVTTLKSCTDTSNGIFIKVNPLPNGQIRASGPLTFCEGDSVVLSSDFSVGCHWQKNGIQITSAIDSFCIASKTGYYNVFVTNSFGCADTLSGLSVNVNDLPDTNMTINGTTVFCDHDSVTLMVPNNNASTWQWKKDGINIPGANYNSFTATQQGNYYVVITSAGMCIDSSKQVFIKVNPRPSAVIKTYTLPTFCDGDSVVIFADTGFVYQWKKDGTDISGENGDYYSAKTSGVYSVYVTNNEGCSSLSYQLNVVVNPLPVVSIGNDTTICYKQKINLNAGNGFESYLWSTGDTTRTAELKGEVLGTGIHNIWVKVENTVGCFASDTIRLTVIACQGVNEGISSDPFEVYPNPTNGTVFFKFNTLLSGSCLLNITDAQQRVVYFNEQAENISGDHPYEINLSNVPDGIYLVTIKLNDKWFSKKIIKHSIR